ncbi:transglycosylase SLT domain-containing protein [Gluconacetobacter diazotrophicus]|uniref:transglycosylase SLT domain-containing protein n=1 Tax=Gluconacetobacter diazotrophicus TaxID=33996 RepID=UPI00287BBC2B|nr:transglycosylase SLT domain-containing protein [Gluconacetobacter diazotrophicus]
MAAAAQSEAAGIGIMGIDPGWLPLLQRVGFDPDLVRTDACMNIAAGAWIMAWAHMNEADPAKSTLPAPRSAPLSPSLSACVTAAARTYKIAEVTFRAVLLTEGGRVGQIHVNRNGSYDMGPAQINSTHLPELARMGITRDQVVNDGCLNIQIGAWILAQSLSGTTTDQPAEYWRRVGNYNSATPTLNAAYQARVWQHVPAAAAAVQTAAAR